MKKRALNPSVVGNEMADALGRVHYSRARLLSERVELVAVASAASQAQDEALRSVDREAAALHALIDEELAVCRGVIRAEMRRNEAAAFVEDVDAHVRKLDDVASALECRDPTISRVVADRVDDLLFAGERLSDKTRTARVSSFSTFVPSPATRPAMLADRVRTILARDTPTDLLLLLDRGHARGRFDDRKTTAHPLIPSLDHPPETSWDRECRSLRRQLQEMHLSLDDRTA